MTLSEVRSRSFVGKVNVAGTTSLGKAVEKGLRAMEFVEGNILNSTSGNSYQNLRNPVWMGGTTRNINHGISCLAAKVSTKIASFSTLEKLKPLRFSRIRSHGWNTTIGSTISHCHYKIRYCCQIAQPVFHRTTCKTIPLASAIRSINNTTFKN